MGKQSLQQLKMGQRCIQSVSLRPGTHPFFFGHTEFRTKGPLGHRKKFDCLYKLQMPGKTCEHQGTCKLLFSDFCILMISFCK